MNKKNKIEEIKVLILILKKIVEMKRNANKQKFR
jgi:hypothetical protein